MRSVLPLMIVLLLSGCGFFYRTLLGVDSTPDWKSDKEIIADFEKFGIPASNRFVLDTASYEAAVTSELRYFIDSIQTNGIVLDSLEKKRVLKIANDNLQPTQIRYFDANGEPVFKMVNCYIDKAILRFDWNLHDCFATFPPTYPDPRLEEGNKPLSYFLPHFTDLTGHRLPALPKADYYAVIFWNDFMTRPSRNLIKTITAYHDQHADKDIYTLYVNNHNAELWSMLDAAQKAEMKRYLSAGNN